MEFLNGQESFYRFTIFITLMLIFMALEAAYPKLQRDSNRLRRWTQHIGVTMTSTLVLRLIFPLLALDFSLHPPVSWGLFQVLHLPPFLEILLCLFLFDLIIYWQHRAFHQLPWLWRLHRMHHSDLVLDTSSALRFHPFEIVISMLIKIGIVILLGASPWAVFIFEILLNGFALFNHANWNIKKWDRPLQRILVTPDMHRVHHSSWVKETNSNYGFCLSLWDHFFSSFLKEEEPNQIGLNEFREKKDQTIWALLKQPFL